MSEQRCPNCKEKGFIWSIQDDEAYTFWKCMHCKYEAEENESLESICNKCGTKNNIFLKSDSDYFQFCTHCQSRVNAKPW